MEAITSITYSLIAAAIVALINKAYRLFKNSKDINSGSSSSSPSEMEVTSGPNIFFADQMAHREMMERAKWF